MKRALLSLLGSLFPSTAPLLVATGSPATAMPDGTARQSFWIRPSATPWDIYVHTDGRRLPNQPEHLHGLRDPSSGALQPSSCPEEDWGQGTP